MPTDQQGDNGSRKEFTQKVLLAVGIAAFAYILLSILQATFNVFLLVMAGVLIAVYFHGLGDLIQRKTKWNRKACMLGSTMGSLALLGLMFWLIGAQVSQQVDQLSDMLPKTIDNAKAYLQQSSIGQNVLDRIHSSDPGNKLQSFLRKFFQSTFGILGDVYVVLFLGIFITAAPHLYYKGMMALVPVPGKEKAEDMLPKLGDNLKKWLQGKLFSMLVVAVLTGIGLAIMGIPAWLALSLMAGMLSFVPNFGPLIALIPAVLMGLMQGPMIAAVVAGLYILVQVLENNFITPFVQQKLVNAPPAMILVTQLIAGTLAGLWGVILATPLLVIAMVLTKELYISSQSDQGSD